MFLTLLLLAIRIELLEEGYQVGNLCIVLDAGKDHLVAWHGGLRILDILGEVCFIPGHTRCLVCIRVLESFDRSRLAAEQSVELGADQVFRGFADLMASTTFGK